MGERDTPACLLKNKVPLDNLACFVHLLYRLQVRGAVLCLAELLQNEKKAQNWKNIFEKHKEWSAVVHLKQRIAGNHFL